MQQNQSMAVCTAEEAMFVACQMEESAIALYQRALLLCPEGLRDTVTAILQEEQKHLCRFRSLSSQLEAKVERAVWLSTFAGQLLYPGGLLGAARDGLLNDPQSFLQLAASAEATSVQKYQEFAKLAQGPVKDTLLMIAAEEQQHLQDLKRWQLQLTEKA